MSGFFSDRWNRVVSLLIFFALLGAWLLRHLEDDAFITFRYSKHLAEGFGAVWNVGEVPLEGYTNALWMLLMAAPELLGIDTVFIAHFLGITFLGLNLLFAWQLVLRLGASGAAALLVFLPVALNYTLLCYGTSGLETSMNGFLWTCMAYVVVDALEGRKMKGAGKSILLGGMAFLLFLSRPDGLLMAFAALEFAFLYKVARRAWAMAAFLIPSAIFLLLKYNFYGQLLPNTFYVKGLGLEMGDGLYYLAALVVVYGLFLPLGHFLWAAAFRKETLSPSIAFLSVVCMLWLGYLVAIGGDYMEFRMAVPVLPILLVLGGEMWRRTGARRFSRVLAAVLVLFSGLHAAGHGRLYQLGFVTPVHRAVSEGAPPYLGLRAQAEGLSDLFSPDSSLVFASGNIGAYAYENEFRWVDFYGLNDAWIARNGEYRDWGPGHRVVAPFEHLLDRGVNLVSVACFHVGQPAVEGPFSASREEFGWVLGEWRPKGEPVRVVALPIAESHRLLCLYLSPHPQVDSLIAARNLKIWDLRFDEP